MRQALGWTTAVEEGVGVTSDTRDGKGNEFIHGSTRAFSAVHAVDRCRSCGCLLCRLQKVAAMERMVSKGMSWKHKGDVTDLVGLVASVTMQAVQLLCLFGFLCLRFWRPGSPAYFMALYQQGLSSTKCKLWSAECSLWLARH